MKNKKMNPPSTGRTPPQPTYVKSTHLYKAVVTLGGDDGIKAVFLYRKLFSS